MSGHSQFALLTQRRFLPYFIVQALGAFNDNLFKTALLVALTFDTASWTTQDPALLNNLVAGLFILPLARPAAWRPGTDYRWLAADNSGNNGLSAITPYDLDGNGSVDLAKTTEDVANQVTDALTEAGVSPETVKAIQAGRTPKSAKKDELAILDFVKELYKTRRVSDKTYKKLHGLFGDAGMVELVGICGYYALISMTLNVFRAEIPADMPLPFKEP